MSFDGVRSLPNLLHQANIKTGNWAIHHQNHSYHFSIPHQILQEVNINLCKVDTKNMHLQSGSTIEILMCKTWIFYFWKGFYRNQFLWFLTDLTNMN